MARRRLLKLSAQVTVLISILASTSLSDGSNSTSTSTSSTTDESGIVSAVDDDAGNKTQLYLGGFFSLGGGLDNTGLVPATDMAFDHVNARDDLLADYELNMIWNDTQCQAGLATRSLFDQIFKEPQKILIIGPGCSTATQAVAETAYHWNLITMSYTASSPALSDREKYPFFYRTYPSDSMLNPARIRLMKEFNWSRVATIHQNEELFALATDNLLTLLKEANITLITAESFATDPKNQVENLKTKDAKVIVASMYEDMGRRVFCEAYKLGMTGEGYVWFLLGWWADQWYLKADEGMTCTRAELKEAVEGSLYIMTGTLTLSQSEQPSISGMTADEFTSEVKHRLDNNPGKYPGYTYNVKGPFAYDAVWALALMLNRTAEDLKTWWFDDGASRRRLEDFHYDDGEMAQLFFDNLNETSFEGVSGPVSFSGTTGDRVGMAVIEQLQPFCPRDTHYLVDSWCITPVDTAQSWQAAVEACMGNVDANATLSPIFDSAKYAKIKQLNETDYPNWLKDRWYIGFYENASGLQAVVNGSDVDGANAKMSTSSSSITGCVVIDFSQSGQLDVVNCDEEYPYICAEHAEFKENQIGLYGLADDYLELTEPIWPGYVSEVPTDITMSAETKVYLLIDVYLYVIMSCLASIGILVALGFLAFNINYRKQRFVKLSSPNLNNLIILGSVLVYSWIFFNGLDRNTTSEASLKAICQLKHWFISLGFVTAFGAMFSKTWRVHRVATFKKPRRRIVRDSQLYGMVLVLLSVEVIILIAWQIADPLFLQEKTLFEKTDPDQVSVTITVIEYCTSNHSSYWVVALYVYKGLLLLFGTFLAWETRKVTIPALNDSKLIGVSVYNIFILCAIGVGVNLALKDNPAVGFIFLSIIALFCTSITLSVVFVPKIISVYKDPEGENAIGKRRPPGVAISDLSTTPVGSAIHNDRTPSQVEFSDYQVEKMSERKGSGGETKSSGGMMADADPIACGVWCLGRTCSCSFLKACFTDSDDDDGDGELGSHSGKYVVKDKSYGNALTGNTELTALSISVGGRKSSTSDSPESTSKIGEAGCKNEAYDVTFDSTTASRKADVTKTSLGTRRTTLEVPAVTK